MHEVKLHTGLADYTIKIHRTGWYAPIYAWAIYLDDQLIKECDICSYTQQGVVSDVRAYVERRFGPLVASQLDRLELPSGL